MKISMDRIVEVYPQYESNKEYYDNRLSEVKEGYYKTFGTDEVRMFSAPGRIEIGGNHTDHQKGCVLAAAIDLDVLGVASKNNSSIIRVYSKGYGLIEVDTSSLEVDKSLFNTTQSLLLGVYKGIQNLGYDLGGVNVYCTSDVLGGSGLSSSAAFEVFFGTVLNNLYCNGEISDVEIAKIGQYAENVYFGKPCGLMDQMASSVGNVVAIDFKDPSTPIIEKVEFSCEDMKHAICIIDSGADHADLTDDYAMITREMAAVANLFGKEHLRDVSKVEIMSSVAGICNSAGDRAFLRALHFQNENERAVLEADALKAKEYTEFFNLVKESGKSSYMYLQNIYSVSSPLNQKVAVALLLCKELLRGKGAYRVHGGGFAGTVQAFVPYEELAYFKENIESVLGIGKCYVLSIRQVGGVEII